ncbi:PPE domain-containing protein [Mycobacterium uberis]
MPSMPHWSRPIFDANTITIALNDADYIGMWVQETTTMNVYQGAQT